MRGPNATLHFYHVRNISAPAAHRGRLNRRAPEAQPRYFIIRRRSLPRTCKRDTIEMKNIRWPSLRELSPFILESTIALTFIRSILNQIVDFHVTFPAFAALLPRLFAIDP